MELRLTNLYQAPMVSIMDVTNPIMSRRITDPPGDPADEIAGIMKRRKLNVTEKGREAERTNNSSICFARFAKMVDTLTDAFHAAVVAKSPASIIIGAKPL